MAALVTVARFTTHQSHEDLVAIQLEHIPNPRGLNLVVYAMKSTSRSMVVSNHPFLLNLP